MPVPELPRSSTFEGACRPCGPTPSTRTSRSAVPIDRHAERLERRLRREAVFAGEEAVDHRRPSAIAPSISARCEIDLSPGTVMRARRPVVGCARKLADAASRPEGSKNGFGNEPSTLNKSAFAFISSSALFTGGSSAWPSRSTKNT